MKFATTVRDSVRTVVADFSGSICGSQREPDFSFAEKYETATAGHQMIRLFSGKGLIASRRLCQWIRRLNSGAGPSFHPGA